MSQLNSQPRNTRRQFLASASAGAAIAPTILRSGFAQEAKKRTVASIGVGGSRGRYSRGGNIARAGGQARKNGRGLRY